MIVTSSDVELIIITTVYIEIQTTISESSEMTISQSVYGEMK